MFVGADIDLVDGNVVSLHGFSQDDSGVISNGATLSGDIRGRCSHFEAFGSQSWPLDDLQQEEAQHACAQCEKGDEQDPVGAPSRLLPPRTSVHLVSLSSCALFTTKSGLAALDGAVRQRDEPGGSCRNHTKIACRFFEGLR